MSKAKSVRDARPTTCRVGIQAVKSTRTSRLQQERIMFVLTNSNTGHSRLIDATRGAFASHGNVQGTALPGPKCQCGTARQCGEILAKQHPGDWMRLSLEAKERCIWPHPGDDVLLPINLPLKPCV